MRFFTADLHLGHANIIGFCDRPFASVEAMNDALLANWADTVGEDDEIWVLGDVAMGRIAETLQPIASLPGRKQAENECRPDQVSHSTTPLPFGLMHRGSTSRQHT